MSREIKFRAWDTAKNFMCFFGPTFDVDDDYNTLSFLTPAGLAEPIGDHDAMKRYTLMQYTGLKDKNGTDIYEGDVVQYLDHEHRLMDDVTGSITYNAPQWVIRDRNDDHEISMVLNTRGSLGMNHFEVIGNIYENPELGL